MNLEIYLIFAEPTGLLIDSAMKLVLSCIPEVSKEDKREALDRASNLALMRGVTTVVDFGRYFPGASVELPWEDLTGINIINLICYNIKYDRNVKPFNAS